MKKLFTLSLILLCLISVAQNPRPLISELNRCDVNTVLLWPVPNIDEYPLWSKNSDYLAFNQMGRWIKLNLNEVFLTPADWRGRTIGMNTTEVLDSVTTEDLEEYKKATIYDPRKVTTKDGITLELKMTDSYTEFAIVDKNKKEKRLLQTGGDNCHSLSLSPNEKFVAFISEMNGLMVYCIDETLYKNNIPKHILLTNKAINTFSKNIVKSEKLFNEAIALDNKYSEPYYWKASIEMSKNNDSLSIYYLNKASEIDPNFSNYYFAIGLLYKELNKNNLAITSFIEYTKKKPFDLHGYYELGLLYIEIGNNKEACDNFRLAKKYHSTRAQEKIEELCKE